MLAISQQRQGDTFNRKVLVGGQKIKVAGTILCVLQNPEQGKTMNWVVAVKKDIVHIYRIYSEGKKCFELDC
jgi:hypothetical protein